MVQPATKVTVTIPSGLYQAVEWVRKATGKSRSAVIQDALRHWLDSQAQAVLVREYEAGYRRKPEGRREIKTAEAAAVCLLSNRPAHAQQSGAVGKADVWPETLGAWRRRESAPITIRRVRKRFSQSFQRHHRRP